MSETNNLFSSFVYHIETMEDPNTNTGDLTVYLMESQGEKRCVRFDSIHFDCFEDNYQEIRKNLNFLCTNRQLFEQLVDEVEEMLDFYSEDENGNHLR